MPLTLQVQNSFQRGNRYVIEMTKFKDSFVNKEERFSVGIEEETGKFYLSIPVSNGLVDYEEFYEIDRNSFDSFQSDMNVALAFVIRCRKREVDDLLFHKPGSNRGVAI